jgi:hypothetical protein
MTVDRLLTVTSLFTIVNMVIVVFEPHGAHDFGDALTAL